MGTKRIDARRKWRSNMPMKGSGYRKQQFTCPYCGGVYGCSDDGQIGTWSVKILQRHRETCSKRPQEFDPEK